MESSEIVIGLIGILSSVITFFLTKRKYNTEVDYNLIKNMETSLEFYKKLSDDTQIRLDQLVNSNRALEEEVRELRAKVLELSLSMKSDYKN